MILKKLTSVVGLKDISGDQIDPATDTSLQTIQETLGDVLTALQAIDDNTDTLEVKAETINLNTDTLESKVQSVKDQLDVLLSTRASEVTLGLVKTNLDDVKTKLDTLTAKDYATQTTLDLVRTAVDSLVVELDVALSTRATEITLSSVKTNLDDLKTKIDTLNAKDFATQTTLALVKMAIDNIYTRFDVSLSTIASEITLGDISISGVDISGLKKRILTDELGRLVVSNELPNSKALTINYERTVNIPASIAGNWFKAIHHTIPATYKFFVSQFVVESADSHMMARIAKFINMGQYNINTHLFTSGSAYPLPLFSSSVEAEVTTVIGAANPIVLTITYTNQDGIPNRTGLITLTENLVVGTKAPMLFQEPDYGCRSITAIVQDKSNTGIVTLEGTVALAYTSCPIAKQTYIIPASKDCLLAYGGETLAIDFSVKTASNVLRKLQVMGVIVQI